MEDNAKIIEELLAKATEYGKKEIELLKLRTLYKSTDIVSTTVPKFIVTAIAATFLLFLNLGLAFWLGGLLGNIYFGFLAVAAFYGIIALVLHLFMRKWLKKLVGNYIVRHVFN